MTICVRPECQSTAGCRCGAGNYWPVMIPSPRTLPVILPISEFGVTIAILDKNGNLTVKVDQPDPANEEG